MATTSATPVVRVGVELEGSRATTVVMRGEEVAAVRTVVQPTPGQALRKALEGVSEKTVVTVGVTTKPVKELNDATPRVVAGAVTYAVAPDVLVDLQKALSAYPKGRITATGAMPLHPFGQAVSLRLGYDQVDLTFVTGDKTITQVLPVEGFATVIALLGSGDQVAYTRLRSVFTKGGVEDVTGAVAVDDWFTQVFRAAKTTIGQWHAQGLEVPEKVFTWGYPAQAVSLPLIRTDHGLAPGLPLPKLAAALLRVKPEDRAVAFNATALALSATLPHFSTPDAAGKKRFGWGVKNWPTPVKVGAGLAVSTLGLTWAILSAAPEPDRALPAVTTADFTQILEQTQTFDLPEFEISDHKVTFTYRPQSLDQGLTWVQTFPFPAETTTLSPTLVQITTPLSYFMH